MAGNDGETSVFCASEIYGGLVGMRKESVRMVTAVESVVMVARATMGQFRVGTMCELDLVGVGERGDVVLRLGWALSLCGSCWKGVVKV